MSLTNHPQFPWATLQTWTCTSSPSLHTQFHPIIVPKRHVVIVEYAHRCLILWGTSLQLGGVRDLPSLSNSQFRFVGHSKHLQFLKEYILFHPNLIQSHPWLFFSISIYGWMEQYIFVWFEGFLAFITTVTGRQTFTCVCTCFFFFFCYINLVRVFYGNPIWSYIRFSMM